MGQAAKGMKKEALLAVNVKTNTRKRKTMATILVVDDDSQIRAMLGQILERAGYDVVLAADGEAGCQLFRASPTDIIIMDMVMPEKGGVETIMELHTEFPDVKIIAMSGGGRTGPYGYLKLAERFGAERVFSKPLSKEKILEAIRELVPS
jgi:CheY-like chemotaxis protein